MDCEWLWMSLDYKNIGKAGYMHIEGVFKSISLCPYFDLYIKPNLKQFILNLEKVSESPSVFFKSKFNFHFWNSH